VLSTDRLFAFLQGFLKVSALTAGLAVMGGNGVAAQTPAQPTNQNQPASAAPAASPQAAPASDSKGTPAAPQSKSTVKHDAILPYMPAGVEKDTGKPLYETIQEDWSSLAIGVSKLEPEPALVAQTEEQNTFTRTLVQVKWRPGDPIDLWIIQPKKTNGKKPPVVLYLYGYKDDTARFRNDGWCERVTSGGVAAVGFVSALSGPRFHDRPLRQWFVSELQESLGSTVHDVHFILDYLTQRGDLDMDRVGMFGQSSGGTIALLSAAADPRIKAVDALDPWGDWPVWLAKSPIVGEDPSQTKFTNAAFLKKVAPLDPVKWLPTLKSTRVRIQFVKDAGSTPLLCNAAMKRAAPKGADVVEFDHIAALGAAEGRGRLFDWLKDQLKSLPAQPAAKALVTQAHSQDSGSRAPAPQVH
jgi:hypothetical protein